MAKTVVSQEALRQALVNINNLFVRKDGAKVLSTNDFTAEYKNMLDNLNQYALTPATTAALGGIIVGAGLAVANDGTLSLDTLEISDIVGLADALATKAAASELTTLAAKVNDASNGLDSKVATSTYNTKVSEIETALGNKVASTTLFDQNDLIKSDLLPSYVDDVVEGYYDSTAGKFYSDSEKTTEITGEQGKIYLDKTSNCSYRFGGSAYVLITSADIEMMTAYNVNAVFNEVFNTSLATSD